MYANLLLFLVYLVADFFLQVRTWKYRFAKEVLGPTSEYMGKVRPVKYSEILELDRKIREFPDYYYPSNTENESEFNPRVLMWRNWKEIREFSLLRRLI